MRLVEALLLMVAAQSIAAGAAPAPKESSAAGVHFRWSVDGKDLRACMRAQTRGWIAVGFNPAQGLAGSRLVMGQWVGNVAVAQVHQAQPPDHHHRKAADGSEWVTNVSGLHRDGITQICFTMPLAASYPGDVVLAAGMTITLTLAWSHEADFQHHSAQRSEIRVRL